MGLKYYKEAIKYLSASKGYIIIDISILHVKIFLSFMLPEVKFMHNNLLIYFSKS